MCPFCVSTLGLLVAGSVSTGGLAVLAAKASRKKKKNNPSEIQNPPKGESNDGETNT